MEQLTILLLRFYLRFIEVIKSPGPREQSTILLLGIRLWFIEGSLEVKLPTIWTDEKQSRAEAERRERLEERRSEKRKSQKKEDADARKGRKVAKHCVFPMIWGSGGSKSRLAKAAGEKPAGQNNCTPLWREAHFEGKMHKTHHVRTTFGSWDVEKVHAVVARRTFPSQNVQSTPASDHFWKLRYRKSARRCGAKHISKWKCTKHTSFRPLLEVQMSKKCTPLWREAHFEVKMYKTHHVRTTFGGSDVASLHYTTLHYTTLHYTTLHYTTLHNTTTTTTQLHSTTLNYTTLHYITLHYTPLRYITLHYLPLHFITLHYTTLHYTTTTTTTTQLHSTTLHYTKLHYTTLHYTTFHYTPLHYITLNDTAPQIER